MFFRKRPKPPLEQAIALVHEAVEIAFKHKRDKSYMPSEGDIKLFESLSEALWENHCTAQYIERCMIQRMRGEPEGSKKFTDPEVAAYHYPQ